MRNTITTICNGIAICLVVLSQAGAPDVITRFAAQLGFPILFICFGYQFSTESIGNEGHYLSRRVKDYYWPFLKWSVAFLILHNLFFAIGLVNDSGIAGVVAHSYDWHDFSQRFWSIIFGMSGYDELLCGSFWFFRCIFVAGIAFLFAFKLIKKLRPENDEAKVSAIIAISITLLILWKIANNLVIPGLAEGGYRELLAVILVCLGVLLRRFRSYVKTMWPAALVGLLVSILGCCCLDASFVPDAGYAQFFATLLTSVSGFVVVNWLAILIDKSDTMVKTFFLHTGERMLHVLAFFLIAFKLVSAIKVACYGLPWPAVGGSPIVQHNVGDWFWILYLIAGISIPLLVLSAFKHWASRVDLSLGSILLYTLSVTVRLIRLLVITLRKSALWIWSSIVGIYETIRDIVKASNPKDE